MDQLSLTEASLPRLPPEVLEAVLTNFNPSIPISIFNQSNLLYNLSALSQVSQLFRHWSLQILYEILILPRTVRDFKTLYSRLRETHPPFNCSGFTRAVFSGIPDIGQLTSMSAGWESDLLRLLHYCGERVEILSLWDSESRVLLRDTGQVRGGREGVKKRLADRKRGKQDGDVEAGDVKRNQKSKGGVGTSQPLLLWGEESSSASSSSSYSDSDSDSDSESNLSNSLTGSNLLSKEELEAQLERERQTLPNWLRHELEHSDQSKVVRNYKAHLTPTVQMREQSKRRLEELKRQNGRVPKGCKPKRMSLMFQLPLFEHEDRELFRRMLCWRKCEELDVHVPITTHVSKALQLFSSLHSSPLKRLRISSIHASLVLALGPFSRSNANVQEESQDYHYSYHSQEISSPKGKTKEKKKKSLNLTKILEKILKSSLLKESLMKEFLNSPIAEVEMLEKALLDVALRTIYSEEEMEYREKRKGTELIRIKIIQGKQQAKWGKLKERLNDFNERAQGKGEGSWKTLGVWDD